MRFMTDTEMIYPRRLMREQARGHLFQEDFAGDRNGFVASPADHGIARNRNTRIVIVRPFLAILVQETCRTLREGLVRKRSRVIVRHLMQNATFTSRRALLRGMVSSASVLALGGCAN